MHREVLKKSDLQNNFRMDNHRYDCYKLGLREMIMTKSLTGKGKLFVYELIKGPNIIPGIGFFSQKTV